MGQRGVVEGNGDNSTWKKKKEERKNLVYEAKELWFQKLVLRSQSHGCGDNLEFLKDNLFRKPKKSAITTNNSL